MFGSSRRTYVNAAIAAAAFSLTSSTVLAAGAQSTRGPRATGSNVLAAAAKGAKGSVDVRGDGHLEERVWTSDEHELPALEREVTHLIQEDPHSARAHQLLSHVLVRIFTRDPSDLYLLRQAADLAQQAVDLAPKSPLGYAALADILDLMGTPERGVKLLNEAQAQGIAANWRFAFTRARLISDGAPTSQILAELKLALSLPQSEHRIIVPYVVALLQAEYTGRDLIAKIATWNEQFPCPLFDLTTAMTLTELGSFREAHDVYSGMLQVEPTDKEAMVNDAIVLYRDLHHEKQGAKLLEQALAAHHHDLTAETRAMITSHLGAAYVRLHKWPEAKAQFVAAVAGVHDNLSLIDFMARTYRAAAAPAQLVAVLKELNNTVQGTGVLYALLGETQSEQLSHHDDAIHSFADAITLDPDRADYYNGLGLALYRKKAFDDALKAFAFATEVDPNDATARYNQACVLAVVGRRDEALNMLAEAIGIDPHLTVTAQNDVDFDGLKASAAFRSLVQGATAAPATEVAH